PAVLAPGLAAFRPPGVLVGLRVDLAERVDVADVAEQLIEPGALLGQEARGLLVREPVAQVDFGVRDVPVAAQDEVAALALARAQMRHELVEEAELRALPILAGGAG